MSSSANNSGLRDNYTRGTVADFLTATICDGSKLCIVSAYFTIYAYKALKEAWSGDIPHDQRTSFWGEGWAEEAWMIEGQPWGKQPQFKPVAVPPINEILGRTIFGRGAIIPGLHLDDLECIRSEALKRELNPDLVPYLKREPLNEQEVLAIVVADGA
jgi:hypothetical protein